MKTLIICYDKNFMNRFSTKIIFLVLLGFFSISSNLFAQGNSVSGKVVDENNEGIPGANVMIANSSSGTTTDIDGNFKLDVTETDVLVISFIGYKNKRVSVGTKTNLTIEMDPDIAQLEEVVVIGYGTTKRANLTTSVESIKSDAINEVPVATLDQAIQGRVSGVQVTKATGAPGGGISIRIRGTATINGNAEPLYVVDGVPINNSFTNSAGQGGANGSFAGNEQINGLAGINPDDIENIEILKDAAAASIYGSRGGNGVVLITTKQGTSGQSDVSLTAYTGVSYIQNRYSLLNGQQFAAAVNEGLNSAGNPDNVVLRDNGINTDWQDEVFQTAPITNVTAGFSGGNDKTTYYTSLGYFGEEGTIINSSFRRMSFRANLSHKFNDKVKIGSNATLGYTNSNRLRNSGGPNVQDAFNGNNSYGASVLSSALVMSPRVPVIDPLTGGYATDSLNLIQNPVQNAEGRDLINNGLRFQGRIFVDWTLAKGLSLFTQVGGDIRDENETFLEEPPIQGGGGSVLKRSFYESLIELRSYLTYNYSIADVGNLNLVVGTSYQQSANDGFTVGARDLLSAQLVTLTGANEALAPTNDEDNGYKIFSNYARLNGDFLDKYLFSATARVDGSSRFGPNNKYGFFPSASVGWRVSNEEFFNFKPINELKFRASYGTVGNDRIPPYRYLATLTALLNSYIGYKPLVIENVANPNYSWESAREFNIGLDMAFLANRIQFTANWFQKTTEDLLLSDQMPAVSGVPRNPFVNIGSMRNTGLEFSVDATVINNSKFRWKVNMNFTAIQQEVLALRDNVPIERGGFGYANIATVGEEFSFQLFQLEENVDPATGYLKVKDLDGDGRITREGDLKIVGSPLPDHFGGLRNEFKYGDFDLSVFLQWVYGNDIINSTRGYIENTGKSGLARTGTNLSSDALNRWQQEGDVTNFPRIDYAKPGFNDDSPFNLSKPTDRHLEDGSFLKIRNVSLGYTLPAKMLENVKFRSMRVSLTAFNIWTFTNYSGYDPEINQDVTAILATGSDNGAYPQPVRFTADLNIKF